MTDLRTILRWLTEHKAAESAEVWVLARDTVEPVVTFEPVEADFVVGTAPVWGEPVPVPLPYSAIYDRLMESYSGGGSLKWEGHPDTYRGSYTPNPQNTIFLLFLPSETQIVETHNEKMEQRESQAREISQEIERNEKPWHELT